MEALDIKYLRDRKILRNDEEIVRTRRLANGPVGEAFDVVTRGERYVRDGQVFWVRRIGFIERMKRWAASRKK